MAPGSPFWASPLLCRTSLKVSTACARVFAQEVGLDEGTARPKQGPPFGGSGPALRAGGRGLWRRDSISRRLERVGSALRGRRDRPRDGLAAGTCAAGAGTLQRSRHRGDPAAAGRCPPRVSHGEKERTSRYARALHACACGPPIANTCAPSSGPKSGYGSPRRSRVCGCVSPQPWLRHCHGARAACALTFGSACDAVRRGLSVRRGASTGSARTVGARARNARGITIRDGATLYPDLLIPFPNHPCRCCFALPCYSTVCGFTPRHK